MSEDQVGEVEVVEEAVEQDAVVEPEVQEPQAGDGLVKALASEREQVKSLKSELAKFRKAAEDQRLESLSEAERAVELARAEGREAALAEVRGERVSVMVRAAAVQAGFADPSDVAGFLDLGGIEPDAAAVDAAVAALAESKPYLLRQKQSVAEPLPQGPQSASQGRERSADEWIRSMVGR